MLSLVHTRLSLGLSIVLYIVPILCYAARSPLGRTSTLQRYPNAIPLLLLSFESYYEMK
nr:MAG TPA: hypothetical protein [Caudoviricetes sp.]